MASPLALVAQAPSEGSPVLESPSSGAGVEGSRFAELLAMLGKGAQAGGRTKAAPAPTARPDAAQKGRSARKADKDANATEAPEGESRPQATKKAEKAEKAEKAAVVRTAAPVPSLAQPVAEGIPVNGIPSPGCILQAALVATGAAAEGTPEAGAGDASPASGRGGRLSPHGALPESPVAGTSSAPSRGAGSPEGIVPTNTVTSPVAPGLAAGSSGNQPQVVPQGMDEAAARVFGAHSAWNGSPVSTSAVVGELASDSLAEAGPEGSIPAGSTGRPVGRASAGVPGGPLKGTVAASQAVGHSEPMNLDTLWLFRGDPAYAAAMTDLSAGVAESTKDLGSLAVVAGTGNGPLAGVRPGRDEDSRARLDEMPGLVASVPGTGREAGDPALASPEGSAAPPIVDASSSSALPGHVGREMARWMQGHTRPLPEGGSLLELRLRPASLGSITIRMAEQNGQLSAQITVSDAGVGHAMTRELPRMAEELARHGVSLSSVSVGTSGAGQDSGGAHTQHPYQEAGSVRSSRREFSMESLTQEGVDAVPVSPLAGGGLVNVRA